MVKHVLFFLAALLVIALCEVAADESVKKDVHKRSVVEHDDDEADDFVTVPKEVAQMIADEIEHADEESNDDEDEIENMEDEKIKKNVKDAWLGRRRRRWG